MPSGFFQPNLQSSAGLQPHSLVRLHALGWAVVCTLVLTFGSPAAVADNRAGGISQLPQLQLHDTSGHEHHLDDMLGNVVLVHFWASWCAPCVREIPSLQRLQVSMRGRAFRLLAINVAENRYRAETAAHRLGLRTPVLLDSEGSTFDAWQAKVLPSSFLIDHEGRAHELPRGPIDWDRKDIRERLDALILAAGPDTAQ